ncbi:MAG TPA: MFS transporter [Candidatus Rothia avicola]|uniref:MFS transporter n=1 Tax=Candidatus Rothia avicola TaxID=2840478 RepID=A0A9D1ZT32_9MICC|nr:MFS transporter [Candidatus Rothia avicola]
MTSAAAPHRGLPPIAIITLSSLTAVGPLAIDMYLAALPAIAVNLGTTTAYAQLTLTAFMVGMGTGQFIVGPLSDKTGRRLPLLIGGFVLAHGTWRDIFKVISVIIAISLVLVLFFIKESLPADKRRTGSLLSAYTGIIEVARIRPMACAMVGFAALSALSLATTPRAESDYALDRPKP